jgi:hypothetical protein
MHIKSNHWSRANWPGTLNEKPLGNRGVVCCLVAMQGFEPRTLRI